MILADPATAAEALFGHRHWSMAREILRSLMRPRARVAVKACHASSKTFTAADAVLLALLLGGDVLTTAPTWEQVRTVLWGEIRRTVRDHADLGWGQVNQTEITLPSGNRALGLSTNEGARFQGFHARPGSFLLLVFDEAPGVLPEIYEAAEGISAGGDVRWLQIGNPVIASGPFYAIYEDESPSWERFTISAFDTPNLAGLTLAELLALPEHELDANPWPFLVTRRWVRERYLEWGQDSPQWQSRVLGQFPAADPYALVPLAWAERAARVATMPEGTPVYAGVDVAGPGDNETVVVVRAADHVEAVIPISAPDARGEIVAALEPYRYRLRRVAVDSAGIGYYVAQHLGDLRFPVAYDNVGERSTKPGRFANLRAELFWRLRERFEADAISGLTDRATRAQLVGLRYRTNSRGLVEIETKERMKRRGVASPDRADAMMLAWAAGRVKDDVPAWLSQPLQEVR